MWTTTRRYAAFRALGLVLGFLATTHSVLATRSAAQTLSQGPVTGGVGGASVALARDAYALSNPASIAAGRRFGVSFAASRSYGLSELDHASSAAYFRTHPLAIAAVVEAFGYEDFRQLTAHLVVATIPASGGLRLGIRTTVRQIRVRDYGSRRFIAASAGAQFPLSKTVTAGLMIDNAVSMRRYSSSLMLRMVAGVRVLLPGELMLLVDLDREREAFSPALHAGVQKSVFGRLVIRAGFATAPSTFAFGLGARHRDVEASVASQRHEPLGWSRSVGVAVGG